MQIRFALVRMHNAELAKTAVYVVGYWNGHWTGRQLYGSSTRPLALRETGAGESRIAGLLNANGLGSVSKQNRNSKPFVEISMLLKRHARLSPAYPGDMAMDWKVASITEKPPRVMYENLIDANGSAVADDVFHSIMQALLDSTHTRSNRVYNLCHNITRRWLRSPRSEYVGHLAATPGAYFRQTYCDPAFGVQAFLRVRDTLCRLGGLIAQCIHASRRGEDFEGLYDDLLTTLREGTLEVNLNAYSRRIAQALEKIHNNTIERAECGHFEEHSAIVSVNVQRGDRAARWCSHCAANRAVVLADTRVLTDRSYAFWSDQHDDWYSYDIDADEGWRDSHGRTRTIMDYSHNVLRTLKPDESLISSHFGDFLMGIELEMTSGVVDRTSAAKDVRRQLGSSYCVIKSDGSLPDNGFEIVTAPRGIKEHIEHFAAWQINSSYRAWDTNRCGMHVHIHSRAFTEMTLGKLLMFFNANSNAQFIRKLAGRHPLTDDWARRYCGLESQEHLDNPKAAVKGKSPERYRIVNMQNLSSREAKRLGLNHEYVNGKYDTIELRIFKASLRKERLLAQIEFAHAVVMFCRVASYRDLSGKTFLQWLAPQGKVYPHLTNWFGVRKSKAITEAGGKPLEETCLDKTAALDMAQFTPRTVPRRPRQLPTGINDTVLPVVPRRARRSSSYF